MCVCVGVLLHGIKKDVSLRQSPSIECFLLVYAGLKCSLPKLKDSHSNVTPNVLPPHCMIQDVIGSLYKKIKEWNANHCVIFFQDGNI